MAEQKETAYVLDPSADGHYPSSDAQTIPPVPGVFLPDEPVAVSTMGITASEAASLVKDTGAPLKRTTAKPPPPPEPGTPSEPPAPVAEENT